MNLKCVRQRRDYIVHFLPPVFTFLNAFPPVFHVIKCKYCDVKMMARKVRGFPSYFIPTIQGFINKGYPLRACSSFLKGWETSSSVPWAVPKFSFSCRRIFSAPYDWLYFSCMNLIFVFLCKGLTCIAFEEAEIIWRLRLRMQPPEVVGGWWWQSGWGVVDTPDDLLITPIDLVCWICLVETHGLRGSIVWRQKGEAGSDLLVEILKKMQQIPIFNNNNYYSI